MSARRLTYPTDLTDKEWQILAPLLPPEKPGGRPRKYPLREVINGIQYVLRAGCAWRLMPHDLPHWQTAYQTLCPRWRITRGKRLCKRLVNHGFDMRVRHHGFAQASLFAVLFCPCDAHKACVTTAGTPSRSPPKAASTL
jgi:transposase